MHIRTQYKKLVLYRIMGLYYPTAHLEVKMKVAYNKET